MTRKLSPTTQKIILLLSAGVILGFSTSPARYFKILKAVAKNWKDINKEELKRTVRRLYKSKMISLKENSDGSETMIILTKKGKEKTLTFKIIDFVIEYFQLKPWARFITADSPDNELHIKKYFKLL